MAKIKTSELVGNALDWAVAKCEGEPYSEVPTVNGIGMEFAASGYSTDSAQGGPIIEREGISTFRCQGDLGKPAVYWAATIEENPWQRNYGPYHTVDEERSVQIYESKVLTGSTLLIAAMRCYVTSKLGDEVEIPEELQNIF